MRLISLAFVSMVAANAHPTVLAHGMGDSCFNDGMKQITKLVGDTLGNYSVCVPTGNRLTDTTNGFFMTMDDNVDVFASKIQADPALADGFNCVGLSQGNLLCRGYIHKYNNPPVKNFLSIHGPVGGVAGFPKCDPDGLLGPVCKPIAELCGDLSYTKVSQNILFQIDYFRDPKRVGTDAYKEFSELAQWNNEGNRVNATYKKNFIAVEKFIMVKAAKDTMIFPNDSEQWGHFADGSLKDIVAMKDTKWYTEDLFGLKTVDEAGKIFFEETSGDHLQFTNEELVGWLHKYF